MTHVKDMSHFILVVGERIRRHKVQKLSSVDVVVYIDRASTVTLRHGRHVVSGES